MKLTNKYDIIYVLKNDVEPGEIKYSLRSLVNFPHGRVWFCGGQPFGLTPDVRMPYKQLGATKWEKVSYTLRKVFSTDELSEDVWLFNDDFFVLKPVKEMDPIYNGTLTQHCDYVERRHGGHPSAYTSELRNCARVLLEKGYGEKNYAVHIPILINRKKGLEVLDMFPTVPMFRSLYGNIANIGGVRGSDVKIANHTDIPNEDATFLSTSDSSFFFGEVGRYIKDRFKERSEYED